MIETEIQPEPPLSEQDAALQVEKEVSLLDVTALLVSKRRFIVRFVVGAALLGVILCFVLPTRYEAHVVLLPPAQNSSLASSLMGQLGNLGSLGALASLSTGGLSLKNPADMYVSLLTSRTVEDAMIRRFELMKEYREKRLSDTRKVFERRTSVEAGAKDGLIRLAIEDRDAKRAADMANAYVEEFRKLSASLAITEAARRRLFFEQQVQEAKNNLSAAEDAMTKTQQSTGVLQIDSQARSLIESAALLRAQVVAKQVQIEGMRSFATDDNPALVLAKQELAALQAQLERLSGSQQGSDLNLSKGRVTEAGMEYLRRYRDLKYKETIFELLAKEFEVAKLDEAREGSIIQVVDAAVTPDKKSFPKPSLVIPLTTLAGLLVAVFWVWFRDRFTQASARPGHREQLEAIKRHWRDNQEKVIRAF
jgi:tyrosine-protein kinase Etk/Wzc